MRRALDWLGTVVFLPCFVLILLVFEILLRVSTLFGKKAVQKTGVALQSTLVWSYRLAGVRVELERSAKPIQGPCIVISNHQSMFDIPLFAWALPELFPKYISKRELGRWLPAVSFNLRRGGHALIDRGDRLESVAAIRQLGQNVVRDRAAAVIFPEGTRARRGEMAPFKTAGPIALLEEAEGAPIVPVCIDNSWRVLEHKMAPIPFGIRLRMWIGEPIERREGDDPRGLIAEAEQKIRDKLAEFRGDARVDVVAARGASG